MSGGTTNIVSFAFRDMVNIHTRGMIMVTAKTERNKYRNASIILLWRFIEGIFVTAVDPDSVIIGPP
jgi:uncharacterized YccA/Bax inhibitor family protein